MDSEPKYFLQTYWYIPVIIGLFFLGAFWLAANIEQVPNEFSAVLTDQSDSRPKISAVTSSHSLATEAGLRVLEQGGTAADAAIATAAVLTVVEPWFSSVLGGGTWGLYYDAQNQQVTSLDGVGVTGSKATPEDYESRAGDPGMHQANVPGAFDGWLLWLLTYGTLDLGDVLLPAIEIAERGYPASEEMVFWLQNQATTTKERPATMAIYGKDEDFVDVGDTVYQTDLANTLRELVAVYDENRLAGREVAIAAARAYFYEGPIAEAIVAYSDEQDGYLTMSDFAQPQAKLREPISIAYNDEIAVFQNPPNSQGITMLLSLNILKDLQLSQYGLDNADAFHLQAEAFKLAFADRYYHVGDPDRIEVPVNGLLGDRHATRQRDRIAMDTAMAWPITDGYEPLPEDVANTTTFHVVDRFGNGAAVTTSLGAQFLVIPETGIHINHRLRFLQIEEGPNQIVPGFKVRHTSNPYMAFKRGRLYMLGGNTGADTQPQAQAQQFISVVEFGLSPQEAVARPRFLSTAFPSTVYPYRVQNTLQFETELPDDVAESLRERGHDLTFLEGTWGNAQMLVLNEDGSDVAIGSDPRTTTSLGKKAIYE